MIKFEKSNNIFSSGYNENLFVFSFVFNVLK